MKRTSKSQPIGNQETHFENGFACLKNTILVGSKDSIREEEKRSHLELAKQEETGWMEKVELLDFCTKRVQLKLEG